MEDAKRRKEEWTRRLCKYEVECLLSLRDALLARGSMLTMGSADVKEIVRDIKSTVSLISDFSYIDRSSRMCGVL